MKKMKELYCKTKLSTIALILVLAVSATLATFPVAAAQAQTKATVCYLGVMPNPVGVHQQVLLHVGITDPLTSVEMGYEGLTVSVIDPEGIESSIEPIRTDATGGTGVSFTPDKVGNYTLTAHFPTQTLTLTPIFGGDPYDLTFLASDSPPVELEVLPEDIPYYPDEPLPSNYWTRPIDPQLRSWLRISGSWPTIPRNLYAPYNEYAPETAHILWTKPMTSGGLVGGDLGVRSFEIGDAYEGKWTSAAGDYAWHSTAIILAGNLYYQESTNENPVVYHCVDLHTGEELWSKVFLDNRTIDFGQIFYWDGFNMHGAFAYLWVASGSDYYVFDAYSGDWVFTVQNVPSGTMMFDELNHLYVLSVNAAAGWMALWNMTALGLSQLSFFGEGSWGLHTHMQTFNATAYPAAWTLNVTIPTNLPGGVIAAEFGDRVIGGTASTEEVSLWGLNLNSTRGAIGAEIFDNTWQAPDYWAEMNLTVADMFGVNWVGASFEDRVVVLWAKETRETFGFSLETGDYLWGPTPRQYYLDALDDTYHESHAIAYGKLYSASVGGVVYCYDIKNGTLLWTYEVADPYTEFLFSNNWWIKPTFVTDGKIYVGHLEHSPIDPRPRGGPFVCLNATDGNVIWRANGLFRQTRWGGRAIIGDSIIATMDTYDQRVYAIGKGPSETIVTAPDITQPLGTPILIKGTIMDVSPGTEDTALQLRFPNGVPAISDEDMSEWMLYVYKQFEIPADATGVEVVFNWVDSEGEWHDLDRTTTDMSGSFSYLWTPPAEGKYTIVATFTGSEGYYASYAQTAVAVGPAEEINLEPVESSVESLESSVSNLTTYILAVLVLVVIALAIAVYSLLKSRK
jgi:outer membrane protein assembly factor BamB